MRKLWSLIGLFAILLIGGCTQNVVGPTETMPVAPLIRVTPGIGLTNEKIVFHATLLSGDTGKKAYVWTFYDRSDTVRLHDSLVKTFKQPGTYKYFVAVYSYTSTSHAAIARDTGEIVIYSFLSAISPSQLRAVKDQPYVFQVVAPGAILSTNYRYTWHIGDSTIVRTGQDTLGFTFTHDGIYPITVQLEDALLGVVSRAVDAVSVGASFQLLEITPRVGSLGQNVKFKLWHPTLAKGSHFEVQWYYGDGASSIGPIDQDSSSHVYNSVGKYIVNGGIFDAATNQFLFFASDTVWISSFPANAMTLSPNQINLPIGATQLFTASHPTLDPRHPYRWVWTSDGNLSQQQWTKFGDTLSIKFDWPGIQRVNLLLYDDSLGIPIASGSATVSTPQPTGFTKAMLFSMTKVSVEFFGVHKYSGWSSSMPSTDIALTLSEDSTLLKDVLLDTLKLTKGWNSASGLPGSCGIFVSFASDWKTCKYVKGLGSGSESGSPGESWHESSRIECADLPLMQITASSISYGVQGPSAVANFRKASYHWDYTWRSNNSLNADYVSTDWNAVPPLPGFRVIFSR
jgi:hypothetical protein